MLLDFTQVGALHIPLTKLGISIKCPIAFHFSSQKLGTVMPCLAKYDSCELSFLVQLSTELHGSKCVRKGCVYEQDLQSALPS